MPTVGPLVRRDREPGTDGLVFPAANLVASVATMIDQEFLADRRLQLGTARRRNMLRLCFCSRRLRPGLRGGLASRAALSSNRAAGESRRGRISSLAARAHAVILPISRRGAGPPVVVVGTSDHLVMATFVAACLCIRWPDASALEHRLKQGHRRHAPVPRHGLHVEPLVSQRAAGLCPTSCPLLSHLLRAQRRGILKLGRPRQGADRRPSAGQ